jgi:hypothetical protein
MKKFNFFLLLFSLFFSQCTKDSQNGIYNIIDYGAKSDGSVQTAALQKAIDGCFKRGGGTVVIPPGEFISGALQLRSNVTLKLENGALLKGSLDTADYLINGIRHGMIYAQNERNIAIVGQGTIDGNGTAFMVSDRSHVSADFDREYTRQGKDFMPEDEIFEDGPVAYDYRPGMMVVILSSENVRIKDVTFKDSPEWTIRFGECDDVWVDGISIYNNLMIPNSDGIHCTASRNIRISNCDIRAGDDAIIITGFPNSIGVDGSDEERDKDLGKDRIGNNLGFAENVTVTNCVLQSRSAGIRIGYGSVPIRRCVFENIVIYGSNRGIGVFARDHANISQIQFNNIIIQTRLHSGHWWGNGEPIHVSAIPQNSEIPVGKISEISFRNITAESETGMVVYAYEPGLVENIQLENVRLTISPGKYIDEYGGNLDLRPSFSKEFSIFKYELPGLLVKNIRHLEIENFDLNWMGDIPGYYKNGIGIEGSSYIRIREFSGKEPHSGSDQAAVSAENSSNIVVEDSYAKPGTDTFIRIMNDRGYSRFENNDMANTRIKIQRH